jgi:nitroreductase
VRHFLKDPVPSELIDHLLKAVSSAAPSAVNQQAYRFYVVTSRPLIQDLAAKILLSLVQHGFDTNACLWLSLSLAVFSCPKNQNEQEKKTKKISSSLDLCALQSNSSQARPRTTLCSTRRRS